MSWQDEARANGYVRAAFNANSDAELERGMQNADKAVDMLDNMLSGIGRALTEPSPPPKTSSGGGLGGLLLAGAAVAGGAYLLSKVFGSSDDKKSSTTSSNGSSNNKTVNSEKKDIIINVNIEADKQKEAMMYLRSGKKYYSKRQYEKAIQDYDKAIRLNPSYAYAYHNRGLAYKELGNTSKANRDFEKVKELGYEF